MSFGSDNEADVPVEDVVGLEHRAFCAVDAGIWELDYTAVDLAALQGAGVCETDVLSAVVCRPQDFHRILHDVRVVSVSDRALEIAGYESEAAAREVRPIRFVRGASDASRIPQLIALVRGHRRFERDVVGIDAAGRQVSCRLFWQAVAVEESGLPSRVAVAVVESPQDTVTAIREG